MIFLGEKRQGLSTACWGRVTESPVLLLPPQSRNQHGTAGLEKGRSPQEPRASQVMHLPRSAQPGFLLEPVTDAVPFPNRMLLRSHNHQPPFPNRMQLPHWCPSPSVPSFNPKSTNPRRSGALERCHSPTFMPRFTRRSTSSAQESWAGSLHRTGKMPR